MLKPLFQILSAIGVLALTATPAWAHPSATPHLHPSELAVVLAAAVGLAGFWWMKRGRSRAG
jgi:hypothetical protein